jgi:hypothetical protein
MVNIPCSNNSQKKSTPPLILAQCYQAGPGSSSDPLKMLTDAKAVCDNLVSSSGCASLGFITIAYGACEPITFGLESTSTCIC